MSPEGNERPTIVLTGASAGIGAAAAVALAGMGCDVLATGRSASKLADVHTRMVAAAPAGFDVRPPITADLASLGEVRRLADVVLATFPRLDVVANNAGLTTGERQVSTEGYELVLAVNHLAPFLLTHLLGERLGESAGRVVTTSSAVHRVGRIHFDDLQLEKRWGGSRAYSQSKLANILFTTELARRTGLPASCYHPGGVATELNRDTSGLARAAASWMRRLLRTPEQGADTLVWLATDPEGAHPSAPYYAKRKPARTSSAAKNTDDAARLWQISAELVGLA